MWFQYRKSTIKKIDIDENENHRIFIVFTIFFSKISIKTEYTYTRYKNAMNYNQMPCNFKVNTKNINPSVCPVTKKPLVSLNMAQNDVTRLGHLRMYSGFSIFDTLHMHAICWWFKSIAWKRNQTHIIVNSMYSFKHVFFLSKYWKLFLSTANVRRYIAIFCTPLIGFEWYMVL